MNFDSKKAAAATTITILSMAGAAQMTASSTAADTDKLQTYNNTKVENMPLQTQEKMNDSHGNNSHELFNNQNRRQCINLSKVDNNAKMKDVSEILC